MYGGSFTARALSFAVESTHETPLGQNIQMDIKKIDMIARSEFDEMLDKSSYKHPVFLKTPLPMGTTYQN